MTKKRPTKSWNDALGERAFRNEQLKNLGCRKIVMEATFE